MNRFQIMGIVTAIQRCESDAFGDSCLTSVLREAVVKAEQEMAYYHDSPVDALKQAESYLIDASNMLDQANDRHKTTTELGKRVDSLLRDVQQLIEYMTCEPEPADAD